MQMLGLLSFALTLLWSSEREKKKKIASQRSILRFSSSPNWSHVSATARVVHWVVTRDGEGIHELGRNTSTSSSHRGHCVRHRH